MLEHRGAMLRASRQGNRHAVIPLFFVLSLVDIFPITSSDHAQNLLRLRGGEWSMLESMNNAIRRDKAAATVRREHFVRHYTDILRHFAPLRVTKRTRAQADPEDTARKKKNTDIRHGKSKRKVDEDEEQLMQQEEDETNGMPLHLPLLHQPSILKGGKLRDYQLEGLNWLARLYSSGISGVLADEVMRMNTNASVNTNVSARCSFETTHWSTCPGRGSEINFFHTKCVFEEFISGQ
jgi:SNF2 family DNA or RNA helicase